MSLWTHLSSGESFGESGINTTKILNLMVDYTGLKLEMLITHPAGKAPTMPLTLIGSPGKVETHGQVGQVRLPAGEASGLAPQRPLGCQPRQPTRYRRLPTYTGQPACPTGTELGQ